MADPERTRERSRLYQLARQRAYRALARRHPEELRAELERQKALVGVRRLMPRLVPPGEEAAP